jgi:hypothetical protein
VDPDRHRDRTGSALPHRPKFVTAEVLIRHSVASLVDCGRRSVLRREGLADPYQSHEHDGNTTAVPSRALSALWNSSAVSDSLRWLQSAQDQTRLPRQLPPRLTGTWCSVSKGPSPPPQYQHDRPGSRRSTRSSGSGWSVSFARAPLQDSA